MIQIYTQQQQGEQWLANYQGKIPQLVCTLGFTETGLIEDISAAGATPKDRQYTAIADAEFLVNGVQLQPQYPLPPLTVGASPTYISRTVVEGLGMQVHLLNAGLPVPPSVPSIDLDGKPAQCVSTGQALPLETVQHLFAQGFYWGQQLGKQTQDSYLMLAECVVGGTTTALGVLTGLGFRTSGKINSSHPQCNHAQKEKIVKMGLSQTPLGEFADPFKVVAAVGDPMQPVVAGMAIAASQYTGVLLAGGTQMLVVYALMRRMIQQEGFSWYPERIALGTTRWVVEDETGDTVGLAKMIGPIPVLAAYLNFNPSRFAALRAYEQGYVKEGVGAGGCAIAASLAQGWNSAKLLNAIETLVQNNTLMTELD